MSERRAVQRASSEQPFWRQPVLLCAWLVPSQPDQWLTLVEKTVHKPSPSAAMGASTTVPGTVVHMRGVHTLW